ncbi:unnamed protein product [Rotaria sp. Silwood2]|nr:unnamed protein product [Rotaria sp. Silwood2]CAF2687998.1 unnamed protein product [Rotaria sp. Silwood2]CAF2919285.1 unnamed protein product [Rotaria sp. Silwood2]CAF3097522.1 unnamed protein product [Rotaria sp. Silwood2]CAF4125853.1 unnamed protein product [Rotaria sp. Silwood2]
MTIGKYLATRFTTLVPPMVVPENPIKLLSMLNRHQTAFFFVAFLAWTMDALDFFSVTLNIIEIAKTYDRKVSDITWGITVTLMLRSIGAIIFGIAGDRFGRKWPFIVNIILYSTIEIITGFCTTFVQFISIRALFGIAMGGIYGNCAATALEDAPVAARGLLSGLLQQGYAFGYLLAAALNLGITKNQPYGWRALFWLAGFLPLLVALWRVFLPETQAFLRVKQEREAARLAHGTDMQVSAVQVFIKSIRPTLAHYWATLIYLVLMMAGFNFLAHGSQDLYPTFLTSQVQFSPGYVTATTMISSCGALVGGTLIGYFSSFFGRRLSILAVLVVGAALIPAYLLPRDRTIMIGAFFEQMCVQGAWGVVPIHLMELTPSQFRSFAVGTSYQLGNLISSASATIEATAGQYFPLPNTKTSSDKHQFDYGKVMAIFLAFTYTFLFIIILLGPEKRNAHDAEKTDTKQSAQLHETQLKLLSPSESTAKYVTE